MTMEKNITLNFYSSEKAVSPVRDPVLHDCVSKRKDRAYLKRDKKFDFVILA